MDLATISHCLAKVLEDNLNDFDADDVIKMIIPRFERLTSLTENEAGAGRERGILGFGVELPDETASARTVVDEFVDALGELPVTHVLKFDDPLLRQDMAHRANEIYAIEMKLRRVLSIVYLHAYAEGDPYDLLQEEVVQPVSKDPTKMEQMKERAENQFFYLTFSQYVGLNRRPEFKFVDLLGLVRKEQEYEGFRDELSRQPVEDEDDAVLLAGLKERMEAIEAMRNCCAHSRRPSRKVKENYRNVRPLLEQLLDDYLARWEPQES